jgi:hypothetical protein
MIPSFLILFFSIHSHAEYRAFLLTFKNDKGETVRTVKSTLDPIQYQDFFIVPQGQSLTYTDTWMCYGPTMDFKDICPSPNGQNSPTPPVPSEQQSRAPAQDQGSK